MSGLPKKILASIENDVKKAAKVAKQPWSGFGPIAEAHMAPDNSAAVVVWRQGGTSEHGRTNFVVGNYVKRDDVWTLRNTVSADYKHEKPTMNIDELVRKEKKAWSKEAVAA
jgi:hypothetical protein